MLVLGKPLGVDAELVLGCKRGLSPSFSSGNNTTRINGALDTNTLDSHVRLPGGTWAVPDTVVLSDRWGNALIGSGGISKDFGETANTGSSYVSPMVTRLVWMGANDGTMIRMDSGGSYLGNMHIQGRPVTGPGTEPADNTYPNRAQIGLHINTTPAGALDGAKCRLEHMSFYQLHTGILIGRNLSNVGATSFTGETDASADSLSAGDLHFYHPYSGSYSGLGSCVHVRTSQSVDLHFEAIYSNGNPAQAVYVERGGKSVFDLIRVSGAGNPYCARVGYLDLNSSTINFGLLIVDAVGGKLLKTDVLGTKQISDQKVNVHSFQVPSSLTVVPQLDLGPGSHYIANGGFLQAGALKMTGVQTGSGDSARYRPCYVHFENVTFWLNPGAGADITDVIDAASSGPYMVTWRNCKFAANTIDGLHHWGAIMEDSDSDTEMKSLITRVPAIAA